MTEIAGATCPTCANVLPAAGQPCPRCATPAPYAGPAYQPMSYPAPYAPMGGPGTPYPPMPYQGGPYPPAPYQPVAYPVRPAKSPGIAVLLTLLWIGAGHLYLDRVGTGLALMGAHFFVGFLLFFIFAPLGFVAWLAAVVCVCVWCSNLAGQINAGTVPPRETW